MKGLSLTLAILFSSFGAANAGDWVVEPYSGAHGHNTALGTAGEGFAALYYNRKTAEMYVCFASWEGIEPKNFVCILMKSPVNGEILVKPAQQFYPLAPFVENHTDELSRSSNIGFWVAGTERDDLRMCLNPSAKPEPVCASPRFKSELDRATVVFPPLGIPKR